MKKRSGTSSHSKSRRKAPEIFVDRSLGRKIGDRLRDSGMVVHLHDDCFAQNTEDEEWLTAVGKRKWLVLTKDKWIRRRQLERDALLAAKLKVFCFMSGNVSFAEMATSISTAMQAMIELAETTKPPFIAGIYRDGSVRLILSPE